MKALVFVTALLVAGVASAACKEGARSTVTITDSNDHVRTEFRTCVNGSYMTAEERAAYVRNPKVTCVEGSRGIVTKSDVTGDRTITEYRTCVNGSYMTAEERAAYVRNPSIRCEEGSFRYEFVTAAGSDNGYYVRKVCKAGKWVNAN